MLPNFLKNIKKLGLLSCLLVCSIVIGCGDSGSKNSFNISVSDFLLTYNGNIRLEQVNLKNDDKDDIIALYQEVGDNVGYKDSLLIAEEYPQGLGVNAFAQANLDTLYDYNLTLENIKKAQIIIKHKDGNKNAVLVEYEITNGFIESIPSTLYMSQLFVENGSTIILMSFSTENSQSRTHISNMFKNIR